MPGARTPIGKVAVELPTVVVVAVGGAVGAVTVVSGGVVGSTDGVFVGVGSDLLAVGVMAVVVVVAVL